MTRRALRELYPDTLPRRGDVRVELRAASEEGVTAVIASIAGLVTGAANEGGFKGLAGRFGRRGLLRFGVPLGGEIRFTRLDTGHSVMMSHELRVVAQPPGLRERSGRRAPATLGCGAILILFRRGNGANERAGCELIESPPRAGHVDGDAPLLSTPGERHGL